MDVFVIEEGEDLQCVCGLLVVFVVVDYYGVVVGDVFLVEQCGEVVVVDVVVYYGVVEFGVLVYFDCVRDVFGFVQQYVFVGFYDYQFWCVQLFGELFCCDELVGFGVFGEFWGGGIEFDGYGIFKYCVGEGVGVDGVVLICFF